MKTEQGLETKGQDLSPGAHATWPKVAIMISGGKAAGSSGYTIRDRMGKIMGEERLVRWHGWHRNMERRLIEIINQYLKEKQSVTQED